MTPAEAKAAVAQQDEPKQKRAPKKREILEYYSQTENNIIY